MCKTNKRNSIQGKSAANLVILSLFYVHFWLVGTRVRDSLCMANVGERAVEGDTVTDVNVEAVLPVGLIHPVRVCQRERFPLLAVTCVKYKHTGGYMYEASSGSQN